jgi:hypothetical protein
MHAFFEVGMVLADQYVKHRISFCGCKCRWRKPDNSHPTRTRRLQQAKAAAPAAGLPFSPAEQVHWPSIRHFFGKLLSRCKK